MSAGWLILSLLSAPRPAAACGPFFPTAMLQRSDAELWAAPLHSFSREVVALYPETSAALTHRSTLQADLDDLGAAMGAAAPRAAIEALREKTHSTSWRPPPPPTAADIPAGLPEEFTLYLQGAVAWHQGDLDQARARWRAVLALPPAKRRHRSVWAAYMLGRSHAVGAGSDADETARWMERARALAEEGYPDSLELVAASYGWQAHVALWTDEDPLAAIALYGEQIRRGDRSAALSLRTVARQALQGDLDEAARDPAMRRLVTLWLISHRGDPETEAAWLDAVERLDIGGRHEGADRLAGIAYQSGDMERARRWLAQAPETPYASWIQGRLAMRAGDAEAAAEHLAAAADAYGERDESWQVFWRDGFEFDPIDPAHEALAESGAMLVHAGRYTEALAAFAEAEHWLDVAYLAERLLTIEELKAHVDSLPPPPAPPAPTPAPPAGEEPVDVPELTADVWASDRTQRTLRDVLARRLMREGRRAEAAAYYADPQVAEAARRYAGALDRAEDRGSSAQQRAEALWEAARLARWSGMDLMGTDLGPDFAYTGGSYDGPAVAPFRLEYLGEQTYAPTADERRRVEANRPDPDKRFHYRYRAAEHAWQAAALLPDDDTATVKVLCQAGQWLMFKDPQAADRYYKAMVTRGWNNRLSQQADQLRWFPSTEACAMDELVLDDPGAMSETGCAAAPTPAPRRGVAALLALGAVLLGRRRRREA